MRDQRGHPVSERRERSRRPRHPVTTARARRRRRLMFWVLIACLAAPLFVRFPGSQPLPGKAGTEPAGTLVSKSVSPIQFADQHLKGGLAQLP
jgi:hypothetical protein